MLRVEPRALNMLHKHSLTKPSIPQAHILNSLGESFNNADHYGKKLRNGRGNLIELLLKSY